MDKVITYFLAAVSVLVVPIRGQVFKGKNSQRICVLAKRERNGKRKGNANLSAGSQHVCCTCDQSMSCKIGQVLYSVFLFSLALKFLSTINVFFFKLMECLMAYTCHSALSFESHNCIYCLFGDTVT